MGFTQSLFQDALDWFLPGACFCCGNLLPHRDSFGPRHPRAEQLLRYLCPRCMSRIQLALPTCPCSRPNPNPGASCTLCESLPSVPRPIVSGFIFTNPMDTLVHALKYNQGRYLVPTLMELYWDALGMELKRMVSEQQLQLIIPIPLTRSRRWKRGFNQAEDLALGLADRLGIPCVPHLLKRVKFVQPQARLQDAAARSQNVEGAFEVAALPTDSRRILLIDDVMTTGATLAAASKALHAAGAEYVQASTLCTAYPATDRRYLFSERCALELPLLPH
ncbi:MAG: phosphoribosyltransferase family protein [Candidatus Sumerlaeia bacterium]|nr:phosphoribosyltransferase family protein [Candidatus Sumerlaeia bacterium]